jgi:hypothetical protein
MMHSRLTQLDPTIPVIVTSSLNAKGRALGRVDYGEDHHIIWIVALDLNGEIWHVPNPEIRLDKNWSMQRRD